MPAQQMTPGLFQQNLNQGQPGNNLGATPWGNNSGMGWLTNPGQHPLDNGVTQHAQTGASMFPSAAAGYSTIPGFGNRSYSPDQQQQAQQAALFQAGTAMTPELQAINQQMQDREYAERPGVEAGQRAFAEQHNPFGEQREQRMASQTADLQAQGIDPVSSGQNFNQQYGGGNPLEAAVNYGRQNGPAPMAQGPTYAMDNGPMGIGSTRLPNMNNRAGLNQPLQPAPAPSPFPPTQPSAQPGQPPPIQQQPAASQGYISQWNQPGVDPHRAGFPDAPQAQNSGAQVPGDFPAIPGRPTGRMFNGSHETYPEPISPAQTPEPQGNWLLGNSQQPAAQPAAQPAPTQQPASAAPQQQSARQGNWLMGKQQPMQSFKRQRQPKMPKQQSPQAQPMGSSLAQ